MEDSNKNACVSCGHNFNGRFCNLCGEKVVQREEHTLHYFFGEVINAFTFADTKAWKTIKYLFTKPGVLPLRYINGHRKAFISPLPLFLMINILYFLTSPVDTFNSYYSTQMNGQPYSSLIYDYGMGVMERSGLGEAAFAKQYNAHSVNISKSIILLLPVFFAFPLWVLFHKHSSYMFDHLMFSISLISFILLGIFLLLPWLIAGVLYSAEWLHRPLDFNWNGTLAFSLPLIILGTYLGVGLKNFYRERTMLVVLKTALLIISFIVLMFFYRFILFFLTIWTV